MSTKIKMFLVHQLLIIFCLIHSISCGRQSMKVVEEPSNFGMNVGNYQAPVPDTKKLVMRVPPSNFSGPPHLKRLVGTCYTMTDASYKYEFCPFSNLTQHEQSLRWNPYSGILGVWQEWEIANNTFVAMLLREGESCGAVARTVRVLFQCGNTTEVKKVEEPSKCQYNLHFHTPLVCHKHSMLVYPTLSAELREEWDMLEGHYQNGEYTTQGYQTLLRRIFEKAGLCLPEIKKKQIQEEAKHKDEEKQKVEQGEFLTLDQCSEEYKKMKEQINTFKTLLEVNGINPDTGKRDDGAVENQIDPHDDHYYHRPDYYQNHYDNDL